MGPSERAEHDQIAWRQFLARQENLDQAQHVGGLVAKLRLDGQQEVEIETAGVVWSGPGLLLEHGPDNAQKGGAELADHGVARQSAVGADSRRRDARKHKAPLGLVLPDREWDHKELDGDFRYRMGLTLNLGPLDDLKIRQKLAGRTQPALYGRATEPQRPAVTAFAIGRTGCISSRG